MSRAATRNPDRRRELREVPLGLPPGLVEPGTKAYRMGPCQIMCSHSERFGWHLSISRLDRLPSWEEARDARYALIPDEVTMALLLPPKAEYINVHEFCLQMHQVPGENER